MKITRNIVLLLALVCMSTVIGFAQAPDDGDMGNGTRSCQTCLVQPPADTNDPDKQDKKADNTSTDDVTIYDFYSKLFQDLLSEILG